MCVLRVLSPADYVRYALWVELHSPLRFLSTWMPAVFRYHPPQQFLHETNPETSL